MFNPEEETAMQLDIQSQGFTLTAGLHDYVTKRLAYSLGHGDQAITRVIVRLSDINGPRGGDDKRCLIEVRLKQLPAVVIADTEADLYLAIDRASDRASRTLARRLVRQRDSRPACREGVDEEGVDGDGEAILQ